MKKFARKAGVILLTILCTVCLACGLSACKPKKSPIGTPEDTTTYRLKTPNDGSLPTMHTPLENIGYIAYTLDNQPYYHTYAYNSSKAMGYEQVTQSWKDHKGERESGYAGGVTINSDISYSSLSKAASQACYIGKNDAYMRGGPRPGKDTTATTENWSTDAPDYYDKAAHLKTYGEFPNEISVYVINAETINRADDVTDNGDGTYTQKFYLNSEAACWYQYGLKTRGNLKGFPLYSSLQISFTFDAQWQLLSSYCEEKTKINPAAMGGIEAPTTSKTSVTYTYGEGAIDEEHYAYLESYYKAHLDNKVVGGKEPAITEPDAITLLGTAFAKVIDGGQQFDVSLKAGSAEYNGKLFAGLGSTSDILGTLDVRLSLGAKGYNQDLYVGFSDGEVKAYYSDTFAATANVGGFGTVINQFKEWAGRFKKPAVTPAAYSPAEEEEGDALAALLGSLKREFTETTACVSLVTDNLLGTGIGADLKINLTRTKTEDDYDYALRNVTVNGITYSGSGILLSAELAPDNSGAAVITHDKSQTPADINDYVNNVYNLLESDKIKASLSIDGTKENVIGMLAGVKVNVDSYIVADSDLAAKVDLSVGIGENSVKLSAYYNVNIHSGDYGTVYLNLQEVNGKELNARVRCDINSTIDAVKDLISVINNGATGENGGAATVSASLAEDGEVNRIAGIINGVLNLNFSKVFGEIYASNSEIRLAVDIDEILGGIGLNIADIKFGTAALALGKDAKDRATLSLTVAALGFEMSVCGSDGALTAPDNKDYTDVNDLISLVKAAAVRVNGIIAAQDILFDIDGRVTVDGLTFAVKGKGEAVWGDTTRVALDVVMYVEDGTSLSARDTVSVKFVYDEAASDGSETAEEPVALLAVNDLGIKIYRSDIEELLNGFNDIRDAIAALTGGDKQTDATPEAAAQLYRSAVTLGAADVSGAVEGVLGSENVQNILSAALGFIGNLTVELTYGEGDPARLESILITHAVNGSLAVGVDDKLWLDFTAYKEDTVNTGNRTEIAQIKASVSEGNGALSAVDWTYDGNSIAFVSTDTATDAFVKIVYNYLFSVIEELSVKNVLGTDTYAVHIELDGASSSIAALSDISVDATLCYTHGIENGLATDKKLAETDLDLDIKGVKVRANARYADEYIFIELSRIANVTLTDIKVRASVYDIYSVVEQVIDLVMNSDILTLVSADGGEGGAQAVKALAAVTAEEKTALTDVVSDLFTLDFTKAVKVARVETPDGGHKNTLTVNVDYVTGLIGPDVPEIGTAVIAVNPATHAIEATVKTERASKAWITLSAAAVARKDYGADWKNGYIDISFVSQLISDAVKTAFTENSDGIKTLNTLYTFESGSIDIDISYSVISTSVNFTNVKLTAGLDENNEFYLVLTAHLKSQSFLVYTVAQEWDVSIAYSNGYITMGRQVGSADEKYKVMTLEYLLENLMDKENSPIRWLLGTSSGAWNLVADNVKLNINTGLTRPKTYSLYEQLAQAKLDNEHNIALSDYINAIAVSANGYGAGYGAGADDMKGTVLKNVTDNYYAFDINPDLIGVVSKLQAAILRGENGLTGVNAYAAIGSNLMLNVKLGNLTADRSAAVPDGFADLVESYGIDFDHAFTETREHMSPIYGCYSTETNVYDACWMLEPHTFTVIDANNEVALIIEDVPYGSTVNLTNVFAPNWTTDNHTHIYGYADENGNAYGSSVAVEGDLVVYSCTVAAYPVSFHIDRNGIGTVAGALSLGDAIPEYPSDFGDYVFMGWYTDVTYTVRVEAFSADVTDLYASFVIKEYEALNGVQYTLGDNGEYSVTGYNADKIAAYTAFDTTLYIENVIDGYPVTSIGAGALANAGIKNVVIPENVTYVGSLAFLDNKDMRTAVFLAERVTFGGKQGTSSDGGYPFYGCTASGDEHLTNLSVYYNEIVAESGETTNGSSDNYVPYWAHVRSYKSGTSTKYRYIGHNGYGATGSTLCGKDRYESSVNDGTRDYVPAGKAWALVNLTVSCVDFNKTVNAEEVVLTRIVNGINVKGEKGSVYIGEEDLRAYVTDVLNSLTYADGYIDAFTVRVSGSVASYAMTDLTVTITEKPQSDWRYAVTLTETTATGIGASLNGDVEEYNGLSFVRAGDTVTVAPRQDNKEFASISSDITGVTFDGDATGYTFAMPECKITVSFALSDKTFHEVTLLSEIAFTYNNYTLTDGVLKNVTAQTTLADAQATEEGYTFIGWAYADGAELKFADPAAANQHGVYRAIWAATRADVDFDYDADTTLPTATVKAGNDGTFYKWYTDNTFTTEVTSIARSTVLYARLSYTIDVAFTGSNTTWYYTENADSADYIDLTYTSKTSWGTTKWTITNGTEIGNANSNKQFSLILEGYSVEISRYWTNAIVIRVYDGEACVITYLIKGFNTSNNNSYRSIGDTNDHYLGVEAQNLTVGENLSVSNTGSNRYYKADNSGSPDTNYYLFGTVSTVCGNISLSAAI